MIFGDEVILSHDGIHVSNKSLETIGIFPGTQVHVLPFRTYEYRESEQGYRFPVDLLVTPISPDAWPFVMRFTLRLKNQPGTLNRALRMFRKLGINILFSECTRSGHHHSVLNVLGEITRLRCKTLSDVYCGLHDWRKSRERIYSRVYDLLYRSQLAEFTASEYAQMVSQHADWLDILEPFVRRGPSAKPLAQVSIRVGKLIQGPSEKLRAACLEELIRGALGGRATGLITREEAQGLDLGDIERDTTTEPVEALRIPAATVDRLRVSAIVEAGRSDAPRGGRATRRGEVLSRLDHWRHRAGDAPGAAQEIRIEELVLREQLGEHPETLKAILESATLAPFLKIRLDRAVLERLKPHVRKQRCQAVLSAAATWSVTEQEYGKLLLRHLNLQEHAEPYVRRQANGVFVCVPELGEGWRSLDPASGKERWPELARLLSQRDRVSPDTLQIPRAVYERVVRAAPEAHRRTLEVAAPGGGDIRCLDLRRLRDDHPELLDEGTGAQIWTELWDDVRGRSLRFSWRGLLQEPVVPLPPEDAGQSDGRWEFHDSIWWTALSIYYRNRQGSADEDAQGRTTSERRGEIALRVGRALCEHYGRRHPAAPVGADAPPQDEPELSLEEILDREVARVQPRVAQQMMHHSRRRMSPLHLYRAVDDEVVILKAVLSAIVTYKRMLCEKLRLLFISDALDDHALAPGSTDSPSTIPSGVYLYNIAFYRYVLCYPFFAEKAIMSSAYFDPEGRHRLVDIINRLNRLPQDRKADWGWEPRIDLDPVVITPVEFLSHAYYHRAYERDVSTTARESLIPLPDAPRTPSLSTVFPERGSATVGIASRNTEDLTMRLCPVPVSELKRFVELELKRYERRCVDACIVRGKEQARRVEVLDQVPVEDDEGDHGCGRPERECEGAHDAPAAARSEEARPAEETIPRVQCPGTSLGLMTAWVNAIHAAGAARDECEEEPLNIWRVYNQTFRSTRKDEAGSIRLLGQARSTHFGDFGEDVSERVRERFECLMRRMFPDCHTWGSEVAASKVSAARVFVSLPFRHPMAETWLASICRIGREMGFGHVDTVRTFTEPVTGKVAETVGRSHAMLQILARALHGDCDSSRREHDGEMDWLFGEYLAAVAMKLKIVRLVDRASMRDRDLKIGRDHASFDFSTEEPFLEFEIQVRKAFEHLRKEIAERLGLG